MKKILLVLFFCALPLFAVLTYGYIGFWPKIISAFIILLVNLVFLWLFRLGLITAVIVLILKLAETIFSQLIIKTQGPFDLFYVTDNIEAVSGIVFSYPWLEIVAFFGLSAAITLAYYFLSKKINLRLSSKIGILLAAAALILIQTTDGRYVFVDHFSFDSSENLEIPGIKYPLINKLQRIAINSEENVILLHLESWNSKSVNGDVLFEDKLYSKPMTPVFLKHSKEGLYFPEFYGNSMQTIRSEENTLCGIADNLGKHYSKREEPFSFKCLPEIFAENGYKTYFFKADDITFHGTKSFMEKIGFDIILNREIMQEEDTEYYWGYRDDIFYQRIFEFLKKESPQKKFVYIAVSTLVHPPYFPKPELAFVHKFENPKNHYEIYANCMNEQDYMLESFFPYYKKHLAENTHLFIFGDTSIPVGINGNVNPHRNIYDDNHLTTLLYFPPKNQDQPGTVDKRYDQISLFHTVLELFSENYRSKHSINEITPNELNQDPHYIRLNQPYSGKLTAIVKYPHKWIYDFKNKSVIYFNLEEDRFEQNPLILFSNVDLENFSEIVLSERTTLEQ